MVLHNSNIQRWIAFVCSVVLLLVAQPDSLAQKRVFSEAVITYAITVVESGENSTLAQAFNGASLKLTLKGYLARTDFSSPLRNQSVIYDAKAGSATMLRESGAEKYMIAMTAQDWQHFNRKYEGITWTKSAETRTIQGMKTMKAVGKMLDGSTIETFYSPDVEVLARGYDGSFASLEGFPLEYQLATGDVVVNYKVVSLVMQPVSMARFDLPTSGYKILEYKQ